MLQLRKCGLRLTSQASMKASQTLDGNWVVWLELGGKPLTDEVGKPRLFEAPTRYQAQCKAYRWYSLEPVFTYEPPSG
ncbi:MAG: hypothetical protein WC314_10345 [Vulcanimicrobiota bacterium]